MKILINLTAQIFKLLYGKRHRNLSYKRTAELGCAGVGEMFETCITGKCIARGIYKESLLSNRKTEYLINTDNLRPTKEAPMANKDITRDSQTLNSPMASSDSQGGDKWCSDALQVRGWLTQTR